LEGKPIDYPPSAQMNLTFKKAPKTKGKKHENMDIPFHEEPWYRKLNPLVNKRNKVWAKITAG